MTSEPFDLAVIDFDGTLCATQPAIIHCMRATLAALTDVAPSEVAIQRVIGRGIGLEDSFVELAGAAVARAPSLLPSLVRAYRERYAQEGNALTTMFPGWPETLRMIAEAGIGVAVVSNKGAAAVESALARFGIVDLVDLVVGDRPGVPKKPDPTLFIEIVAPVFPSVSPERVLVIGDTDVDIRFAKNAGLRSCWARYGYGDAEVCTALTPDFVISAAPELASILVSRLTPRTFSDELVSNERTSLSADELDRPRPVEPD